MHYFSLPSAAQLLLDKAIDPLLCVEGIGRAKITHVQWVEEVIASPRIDFDIHFLASLMQLPFRCREPWIIRACDVRQERCLEMGEFRRIWKLRNGDRDPADLGAGKDEPYGKIPTQSPSHNPDGFPQDIGLHLKKIDRRLQIVHHLISG